MITMFDAPLATLTGLCLSPAPSAVLARVLDART
jgi:hypothetical protein